MKTRGFVSINKTYEGNPSAVTNTEY